ncbi:MAG: hypothetical protein HQ567_33385, partial [Candidatus Nealsonbacteria bacterium]|nr:hypothetical protein [Candidatus Nealsonbacteria bacterium]
MHHIAILVAVLSVIIPCTSHAEVIALPGQWFDQDKGNHAQLRDDFPGAKDPFVRNADGIASGTFYQDLNPRNGKFDPIEYETLAREIPSEGGPYDPAYYRWQTDNSCWIASAANMARYREDVDKYVQWAYTHGIGGPFRGNSTEEHFAFGQPGLQHWCLEKRSDLRDFGVLMKDRTDFAWVDPLDYIAASLRHGSPVGIGIFEEGESVGHALTVYAIDTESRRFRVADSDNDSGGDFPWYSYSSSGNDLTLNYAPSPAMHNVEYVCAFDDFGWWAAGSGRWADPTNWVSRETPESGDTVYLDRSSVGRVVVDSAAQSGNVLMSETAELYVDGGSLTAVGEIACAGNIAVPSGTIQAAVVTLAPDDATTGHLDLDGGLLSVDRIVVGDHGRATITHTAGTLAVNQVLEVGASPRGFGNYQMRGGLLSAPNVTVGYGTFDWIGGTLEVDTLYVSGVSGTFNAEDRTFRIGTEGWPDLILDGFFIADRLVVESDLLSEPKELGGRVRVNQVTGLGDKIEFNDLGIGHPGGSGQGHVVLEAGQRMVAGILRVGAGGAAEFVHLGNVDASHVYVGHLGPFSAPLDALQVRPGWWGLIMGRE